MNTQKTVCFTGHRAIPADEREQLTLSLRQELERQIRAGATVFRAGGALGFDTMAALEVLSQRRLHPDLRLELVLPCPSQADSWSPRDKLLYEKIRAEADSVHYLSPVYFDGLLQMRNRALVDGSDVCIAYLRSSHGGGTAYTASLALREGLEFVNLG